MIQLKHVNLSYDKQKPVLKDVNLIIPEGSTTVIMGESGSGKTSLLKVMIGLLKPDSGQVLVGDTDITQIRGQALAKIRRSMAMVFQNGALFDSLKVWENLGIPLREQRRASLRWIRQEAEKLLRRLGLEGTADMMPSELSGGMRMRVAIARALISKPRVLLYDEPTSGLDPITSDTICDIILELEQQERVTSVLVTHQLMTALRVGTRFVLLHQGEVIFDDTAEALLASDDPQVQEFVRSGLEMEKRQRSLRHLLNPLAAPGALSQALVSAD